MRGRRSQARKILDHMLAGFKVDDDCARDIAGCKRLAARIHDIKIGKGVDRVYGDEIKEQRKAVKLRDRDTGELIDTRVSEYWWEAPPKEGTLF